MPIMELLGFWAYLPGARIAVDTKGVAKSWEACGFADQSHFTAAFRRGTCTTPRAYRRETLL